MHAALSSKVLRTLIPLLACSHCRAAQLLEGRVVTVFTSKVCLGHEPGWQHPESPKRLSTLQDAMHNDWRSKFGALMRISEPVVDVTTEQILRVHSPAHIASLEHAFNKVGGPFSPWVNLDSDTVVSRGTQAAVLRAAGLVIAAVDEAFDTTTISSSRRAFVMARPPGHHAECDRPMGFCLLNNVLIGAAHAQAVYGASRVAILDFDVHHGNGDAAITEDCPNRLYASTHQSPLFPYTGTTPGRAGRHANVLSSPLPAGSGSDEFRAAWQDFLLPAVREFGPDAVFISAGFDAHAQDPLGGLALSDEDFEWISAEIGKLCGEHVPIVSVLEGGYNVVALEGAVQAHIKGLIYS